MFTLSLSLSLSRCRAQTVRGDGVEKVRRERGSHHVPAVWHDRGVHRAQGRQRNQQRRVTVTALIMGCTRSAVTAGGHDSKAGAAQLMPAFAHTFVTYNAASVMSTSYRHNDMSLFFNWSN
jgi:hypothetical protein